MEVAGNREAFSPPRRRTYDVSEPLGPTGHLTWRVQALLEETLLPAARSVDLVRTPTKDYLHRLALEPNVAELFCANTKIVPHGTANTPLDLDLVRATREWYHATAYKPQPGDVDPDRAAEHGVHLAAERLPVGLSELVQRLASDRTLDDVLYALDLWLVYGDASYRVVPRSTTLWLDRRLDAAQASGLRGALLELRPEEARHDSALLLVVPVGWRYMLFQGARGYRRALVDVGRFLAWCEASRPPSLRTAVCMDFYDDRVNALLGLDGVERSVTAIVALFGEQEEP